MKLTLCELAGRLELPLTTLDRWIRQGRIPVFREGDQCEFRMTNLKRWASNHNLAFSSNSQKQTEAVEADPETLLQVMQRGGVFFDLAVADADSAIEAAAARIPGVSQADRSILLNGLRERERMTSTGIGSGVAIPHPRTPIAGVIEESRILTFFLKEPIDFSAVDDRPVFVMFLMLSPSIRIHLHLLSRLSFCVRDDGFVEFLRKRPEPEALFSRIAEFEKNLDAHQK